jgi:mRNA interferase MazF
VPAVRAPSIRSEAHRQSLAVTASAHGFDATDSIRICAVTSDETKAPLFRLPVEQNDRNGLIATSRLMVDKITIVPKCRVGV